MVSQKRTWSSSRAFFVRFTHSFDLLTHSIYSIIHIHITKNDLTLEHRYMRVLVEDRLPAVPEALAAAPGVLRALGLTTETEKQVLEFESSPIDAIFGVMLKERFTECLGRDVAYTLGSAFEELMRQSERFGNATIESSVKMLKALTTEKTPNFAISRLKYVTLMFRPMLTSKVACTKFLNLGGVDLLLRIHASPEVNLDKEKSGDNENSVSSPTSALSMVIRVIGRRVPILLMDKLQTHLSEVLDLDESKNRNRLELVMWILGALQALMNPKNLTTLATSMLAPPIIQALSEDKQLNLLRRVGDLDRKIRTEAVEIENKTKRDEKTEKRYQSLTRFMKKTKSFLITISRLVSSKAFSWKHNSDGDDDDAMVRKTIPEAQSRVMNAVTSLYV